MNRFKETYPQRIKREQAEAWDACIDKSDTVITFDSIIERERLIKVFKRQPFDPAPYIGPYKAQHEALTMEQLAFEERKKNEFYQWFRDASNPCAEIDLSGIRGLGKSMMASYWKNQTLYMNMALNQGRIGSIDRFRMLVVDEYAVIHAFDTAGEYHEIPAKGNAIQNIPIGWYALFCGQWQTRIVHRFRLSPSQVPKAYRLYLRMCHINQPE